MIAFIILLSFLPTSQVPTNHVDLIELNRLLHDDGKVAMQQYIFLRFESVNLDYAYHVADWRLVDKVNRRPEKLRDGWLLTWRDQKDEKHYRVFARVYFETTSNYDPEIKDREVLECGKRRGLVGAK